LDYVLGISLDWGIGKEIYNPIFSQEDLAGTLYGVMYGVTIDFFKAGTTRIKIKY